CGRTAAHRVFSWLRLLFSRRPHGGQNQRQHGSNIDRAPEDVNDVAGRVVYFPSRHLNASPDEPSQGEYHNGDLRLHQIEKTAGLSLFWRDMKLNLLPAQYRV